ncbi:MAG TPA: hypothetical protein PLN91_12230 [Rhodanobacteraceae bacterium]|nr:hypothetical protein [Rhodanobacteraceae bacterium]
MQFVWRVIAIARGFRLAREFKEIESLIGSLNRQNQQQLAQLTLKEFAAAAKCEFPHLYGTPPEARFRPWGSGAEIGLERARSDNPQVRLRGIALWLAAVYYESRGSDVAAIDEVHRSVLRSLRQVKEWAPPEANGSRQAA